MSTRRMENNPFASPGEQQSVEQSGPAVQVNDSSVTSHYAEQVQANIHEHAQRYMPADTQPRFQGMSIDDIDPRKLNLLSEDGTLPLWEAQTFWGSLPAHEGAGPQWMHDFFEVHDGQVYAPVIPRNLGSMTVSVEERQRRFPVWDKRNYGL